MSNVITPTTDKKWKDKVMKKKELDLSIAVRGHDKTKACDQKNTKNTKLEAIISQRSRNEKVTNTNITVFAETRLLTGRVNWKKRENLRLANLDSST